MVNISHLLSLFRCFI